jgi:4-carboxymuconolactone decarboxylase
MPRLPYISRDDLDVNKQQIYDRITETRGTVENSTVALNIFSGLLNSPYAAETVARLGEYLRFNSLLDPVIRETVVLSTAKELHNQYEWSHHEPIAKKVGVRSEVIEAILNGKAPMGLYAKEGVFTQAAKELVQNRTLGKQTFEAVLHLLGPQQTVDLIVLVGYYVMLGTVIGALGIELEPGFDTQLSKNLEDS